MAKERSIDFRRTIPTTIPSFDPPILTHPIIPTWMRSKKSRSGIQRWRSRPDARLIRTVLQQVTATFTLPCSCNWTEEPAARYVRTALRWVTELAYCFGESDPEWDSLNSEIIDVLSRTPVEILCQKCFNNAYADEWKSDEDRCVVEDVTSERLYTECFAPNSLSLLP